MRYKVIAKQYKRPGAYLIHVYDAIVTMSAHAVERNTKLIRVLPEDAGRDLSVGEAGRVVQGQTKLRFVPDAIEGDYNEV